MPPKNDYLRDAHVVCHERECRGLGTQASCWAYALLGPARPQLPSKRFSLDFLRSPTQLQYCRLTLHDAEVSFDKLKIHSLSRSTWEIEQHMHVAKHQMHLTQLGPKFISCVLKRALSLALLSLEYAHILQKPMHLSASQQTSWLPFYTFLR